MGDAFSVLFILSCHSRLGLENKSGWIFCVRQVYFTKSCQQNWVRVNQPFIPFIHHIWGETVLRGTVFIIQTSDRLQYFTILQYKLHSFNIQDDQSTRGLLAKPLKKFPKSCTFTAIQPLLTFAVWCEDECLNEHLLWNSQNREHQKYLLNVIVLREISQ